MDNLTHKMRKIKTMKNIHLAVKNPRIISRAFSWFGPAIILFSLVLLRSAEAAPVTNVYTIDVPCTVPWTDTGINIAAGSQLDITASGTVHYSYSAEQVCDANGGDNTGQQFLSDMMLSNTVCHSLIGKIGGTTDIGTGTPVPEGIPGNGPGFVGTSYGELISNSGELFLGFNDVPSVFWDNSGSFSVTISVVPMPVCAGEIVAWGQNNQGECNVPSPNTGFMAIAAGSQQWLGLKTDGSIVAWGDNTWGECNVPSPNTNFMAVAAGNYMSLGLKSDGSIVAWGFSINGDPRLTVPPPNTNFLAIAAGNGNMLGLKTDGSIVAWGDDYSGECDVPSPNTNFTAIGAGGYHSLGLKTDGSIVAWGDDTWGECDVPAPNTGFVAIAAGWDHSLGLKADGSIVAWGNNMDYWGDYSGQCDVPNPNTNFTAIAAGWSHSLGLKNDGSIVAWGYNAYGECNVPPPNTGFTAISAGGGDFSLGLKCLSSTPCDPMPSGLVGWWQAEGNANDSSGNGNNGTLQNVGFTNGVVGQAFVFYGYFSSPHSQISVPDQPVFELTNSLSIEAWINPAGAGGYSGVILWRGDCRSGYDPYWFQMNGDNTLAFYIQDAANNAAAVNTSTPLANNQWCHVAATLDGNTGTMSIYTNGVLAAQTNTSVRPFGPLIPSLEPTIGIGNVGTPCWDYCPFNGNLDEISLYSRALSQSEIQAIYNAGSSGKCVQVAPGILSQPTNQTVPVDGAATFSVTANGTEPLSYFWLRNSTPIPGANGTNYTLSNVQLSDSGSKFSCLVSNACGTALSSNAVLKVIETMANDLCSGAITISGAAYTNTQSTTKATSMGDPVPDCITDFGNGVWYQFTPPAGGLMIVDTFGSDFDTGLAVYTGSCGSLTEADCNDDTDGVTSQITLPVAAGVTYYILAGGYSAHVGNLVLHLAFLTPPLITTQPTNQTMTEGGNVTFSVTASGTLPLSYQWSFNGTNIAEATNTTLTLTNVQVSQAGNYTVLVTNAYGSILSSNAFLTVTPPPEVPVIFGFNPVLGSNGASVTVSGTNFSPVLSNNIVYFGAVQAAVTAASETNMVVTVPAGATYAPITETVNGLTACANLPFLPTFSGDGSGITVNSFAPRLDLETGDGPGRVVIADLDGDGKPDLIIADSYAGEISIYQNISTNGSLTAGSFAPRVDLPMGIGGTYCDPYTLAVADLDGDGRLDIIAINADNNVVSIFRNISSPGSITTNSFAARMDIPAGNAMRGVAVQDLNGDGRPEIVTANSGDNTISIFQNISTIGNIAFAARVDFAAGDGPESVAIGDLDGDGKPDVVTVNSGNDTVSLLRNISTPGSITTNSFAAKVDIAVLSYPLQVAIGDLDGDGKPDLTVTFYLSQTVSVFRNISIVGSLTTNSFAPEIDFPLGGMGHTPAIADLDGDGKPDLAVVTEQDSLLSIFRNVSTPGSFTNSSFASSVDFSTGDNAWGVAIGDLDGDGRPDIIFCNQYDNTISIYQNAVPFETGSALDHFAWDSIPSPRFVNTPFAVTIRAQDLTNGIFTNFTGTAILGTTNGVAVAPSVSGNFVQGVWTGAVMIPQTISNLVLQADDGLGHFGLANPINVINLPSLEMLHSGSIALFLWPVGYSGFVLETSDSLSPATWVTIPYAPFQIGDQYLMPLEMTGTNGFYRLRFPGP